MSTAAGTPSKLSGANSSPERKDKGKGKNADPSSDQHMEEDEEDEEEEEEEEDDYDEMEEDNDDSEDEEDEIDPSAIVGGKRARPKVDYSSAEAHEKAGLKPGAGGDEDEDEMKP